MVDLREVHAEVLRIELQTTALGPQGQEAAHAGHRRSTAPAVHGNRRQIGPQLPGLRRAGQVIEAQLQRVQLAARRELGQCLPQPGGDSGSGTNQRGQVVELEVLQAHAQGLSPPIELGAVEVDNFPGALYVEVLGHEAPVPGTLRERRLEGQHIHGKGPGAAAFLKTEVATGEAQTRLGLTPTAVEPELGRGLPRKGEGQVQAVPETPKGREIRAAQIGEYVSTPGGGTQRVTYTGRVYREADGGALEATLQVPGAALAFETEGQGQIERLLCSAQQQAAVAQANALNIRQESLEPAAQSATTATAETLQLDRPGLGEFGLQRQAAHLQPR